MIHIEKGNAKFDGSLVLLWAEAEAGLRLLRLYTEEKCGETTAMNSILYAFGNAMISEEKSNELARVAIEKMKGETPRHYKIIEDIYEDLKRKGELE